MAVTLTRVSLASTAELAQSVNYLVSRVDAIYLQQDNSVAAGINTLLNITNQHKIPVFSAYEDPVKHGALLGVVIDEYTIGYEAGVIASRILQGENIEEYSSGCS